ncbi:MAG: ACT domain-containing protein [Wenzhouxiangellaceae bacterium]
MNDPSQARPSIRFELRLSASEGALIRALGLIQRRGFTVGAVDMRSRGEQLRVRLELAPCERCPEVLARQILRLHDVEVVRRLKDRARPRPRPNFGRALAGLFSARPRPAIDGAEA